MKLLILLALIFPTSNAFAISTCEKTVVPLAIEMAKASGQSRLYVRHFIDISADYSEIIVTLGNFDGSRLGSFKMTMGDDYKRVRKCIVKRVEAL